MELNLVTPSFTIETDLNYDKFLQEAEKFTRTCYQSESKPYLREASEKWVGARIRQGHLGICEFHNIAVRFITDRTISHRLVRHRIANFMQMSNNHYLSDNSKVVSVQPVLEKYMKNQKAAAEAFFIWLESITSSVEAYYSMIELGVPSQLASGVLPQAVMTEIVVNMNIRMWRHVLAERTSAAAHPITRDLMLPLKQELEKQLPVFFKNL